MPPKKSAHGGARKPDPKPCPLRPLRAPSCSRRPRASPSKEGVPGARRSNGVPGASPSAADCG
eukprot:10613977-Alexandrium_andersonii.AAC.1